MPNQKPTSIDDILDFIWDYAGRVHTDKAQENIDQALALAEEKGLAAWDDIRTLLETHTPWAEPSVVSPPPPQNTSHWEEARQRRERARHQTSEASQLSPKIRENGAVEMGQGIEVHFDFES
jgi:hypothetical protein